MSTITATYCYVCDAIASFFKSTFTSFLNWAEVASYARAASELSRMGKHEEAKLLLLEKIKLQKELQEVN